MAAPRVIDGDGHIFEDMPAIAKHIPDYYLANWRFNAEGMFPPLDHLTISRTGCCLAHSRVASTLVRMSGSTSWMRSGWNPPFSIRPAASPWARWSTTTGRMPSAGPTTTGSLRPTCVATRVSRAWRCYRCRSPRPRPKSSSARSPSWVCLELCSRSTGLPSPLGAKTYWPVYKVADRLGCSVAVHGGAHEGFGMDHFNVYAPVHAMGHPMGQMVSFGNMIFNGVCDNFPDARFGFLEAGVAWLLMCLERFDRSYETHKHYDLSGDLIRLRDGESVSRYIKRNIKEGRIFVGCEGEEPELAYAIKEVGAEPFVFSTDYPHEVTVEMCRHEIQELMETDDIPDDAKDAVLYRNAQRFL